MMHGREKSDLARGAVKPANNDGRPSAELVERRAGAEGNAGQDRTRRAQDRASVSQGLDRVRHVLPSDTQGGSRVPELGPLGSVRGALSNGRPYRDSEPLVMIAFLPEVLRGHSRCAATGARVDREIRRGRRQTRC